MGKAGRIACITIPWALTVAGFLCLILIETSGWNNGTAGQYYFVQANFSSLDLSSANPAANTTTLTAALELAQTAHILEKIYRVHLWNYCASGEDNGSGAKCADKQAYFYFDPVAVWGLNGTNATSDSSSAAESILWAELNSAKNSAEGLENKLLGKSGKEALDAYRKVAKWMFIAYEVSFWTTLATIVCGVLAIFSRWGSFLTWLFSLVRPLPHPLTHLLLICDDYAANANETSQISTFFTFAAVLTSTALFGALVGALEALLHPYGIKLSLGTHALILTWLAVAFSLAATLFWLFSTCCCLGRSNPHHRSNKGGLWNAEPKGQGYGEFGRGRGGKMQVQKTGGGYERVGSPYLGAGGEEGDRVPLQQYPQKPAGYTAPQQEGGAFEPFRHS
ncbi:hypothetical protein LTR62_003255 [Meristemomyces frigidus]|uniref:SUR7 protein n=1 Tax=Meristemomyces frigidus TaxID=1508187 RepID=A0AAN7YH13_9PEZI|nr:hypothetical protein LTR62_003255 [Meristemomyces frigidus]